MSGLEGTLSKRKRVRTGCLTCRERHLKCGEELPDCKNCRKSHRECKRGIKLSFVDLVCKEPPYIPQAHEWTVEFQDESRLIASEYQGGLSRYTHCDTPDSISPQEPHPETALPKDPEPKRTKKSRATAELRLQISTIDSHYDDRSQTRQDRLREAQLHSRKSSGTSYGRSISTSSTPRDNNPITDGLAQVEDLNTGFKSPLCYRSSNTPAGPSTAPVADAEPPLPIEGVEQSNPDASGNSRSGTITPLGDKPEERQYLSSEEELHFMQIFVTEVALWMDSLDKEKHFSQLIPYHALKCPMLLDALLACGAKHLTLTRQHSDEKALFYYDAASRQLLRNSRDPERNMTECAATAVILNVYEMMSDKPTERMNNIAKAREQIRECGWNAKSTGLGAACFWLNVGMELLSSLAFKWKASWEPEAWGLNMDFKTERDPGSEVIWVHRIFYIVAKIANFRDSQPRFQAASPHDEQLRSQARLAEWKRLNDMCEEWDNACPRTMHPIGRIHPTQQTGSTISLFPNIWLIKRAAIVGRLHYHMALCILAQVNPTASKEPEASRITQKHHAHQVCGIVAHSKDHGVASVSIRSLVIVSEALTEHAEQQEVVTILERIDRETGWKLAGLIIGLKKKWGWMGTEQPSLRAQLLGFAPPGNGPGKTPAGRMAMAQAPPRSPPSQQMMLMPSIQMPITTAPQQMQPNFTATTLRPLQVNALSPDVLNLSNLPYQNIYEHPAWPNMYNSQGLL
ncbi:hypothetical protein F4777DRAFT_494902 [Nemania sp. FL0916]|nr:hypothetical protein F4777DRAFT_494902 [Nemania sp. FL0916]